MEWLSDYPDPTHSLGCPGGPAAGGGSLGGGCGYSNPSLGLSALAKAGLQIPNIGEFGWQVSRMDWVSSEILARSGLGEWSIHQGSVT